MKTLATRVIIAACALSSGMAVAGEGDIDTTFGINGYTKIDVLQELQASGAALDRPVLVSGPNARMYVVSSVLDDTGDDFVWYPAVSRLTADGQIDTTFNGGIATFDFGPDTAFYPRSAVRSWDGGVVMAAEWISVANNSTHPGVCKLTIAGELDVSFGDELGPKPGCRRFNNITSAPPIVGTGLPSNIVARTPDGGYAVAMIEQVGPEMWQTVVSRLDSAGDVITSFGNNGYSVLSDDGSFVANQIIARPNGGILLAGTYITFMGPPTNTSVVVVDLDAEGQFYDSEIISIENLNPVYSYVVPWALEVRQNGEILVAGETVSEDFFGIEHGRVSFLVRLGDELEPIVPTGNQFPDSIYDVNRRAFKFSSNCLYQRVTSMNSLPNGDLMMVGDYQCDEQSDREMFAVRLNDDWTLDTDFGTNGITSVSFNSFGGSNLDDFAPTSLIQDNGKTVIAARHGLAANGAVHGVTRLNTGECDIFCDDFEDN